MMHNENDGMRYPSIDHLVTITHSKYKLVVGAAKRAKALNRKNNPEEQLIANPHSKKAIGIALEEVLEHKIEIVDVSDENNNVASANSDASLESEKVVSEE